MSPKQTIREAFVEASSFLTTCGVTEPQRSAQLLLEHVLQMEGAAYYMALPEPFPEERRAPWERVVTRRGAGEPLQYITGEQEFYGIPFEVTPAVLIPRPETELLVEAVLMQAKRLWPAGGAPSGGASDDGVQRPLECADIGTGSGAIAVTLALHAPRWHVCASDISADALQVAARNAAANGAEVAFLEGNLLEPFAGGWLDILVSNPPYIPAADIPGLQQEVRDHEPRTALDGGTDGLAPYRIMMEQLPLLQAPPRLIGFELGQGQAQDVAELLRGAGHWDEIIIVPDLAGIERHVLGVSSVPR
ncbi:peptide chain release factor N(5)-glutamine methyltransferase [Paenibacillus sp.]|jgi:release factor glutamine methyltransferase|uniref:peptide chain release factor N(5)-glutamine methyltransferase n=1 Tax=Paenibacillus sp. TaxID=58172 RepID=UPI00281AF768|nr:peptide chain release factor N(5)-glutamine methyltransferase [Paenibacillus sp.]MDR0266691.1 peptide chain release factor N(5)-glutamine methyltransferase [Paenibacillus sp.]